jgi:hypothetical protein
MYLFIKQSIICFIVFGLAIFVIDRRVNPVEAKYTLRNMIKINKDLILNHLQASNTNFEIKDYVAYLDSLN